MLSLLPTHHSPPLRLSMHSLHLPWHFLLPFDKPPTFLRPLFCLTHNIPLHLCCVTFNFAQAVWPFCAASPFVPRLRNTGMRQHSRRWLANMPASMYAAPRCPPVRAFTCTRTARTRRYYTPRARARAPTRRCLHTAHALRHTTTLPPAPTARLPPTDACVALCCFNARRYLRVYHSTTCPSPMISTRKAGAVYLFCRCAARRRSLPTYHRPPSRATAYLPIVPAVCWFACPCPPHLYHPPCSSDTSL